MRIDRVLALTAVLSLGACAGARAQGAAPAGPSPASGAPTGNAPAANAPAAATAPANGPAGNAPAANAPVASVPAAGKSLTVKVPSGGEYTAYIQENAAAAPKALTDKVDLELPSVARATVYVLDKKTGYAARKQVETKSPPAELAFDSRDFTLVQRLKVTATGKDDKPIAGGTVTVADGGKNTIRKILQSADQGSVEFEFLRTGAGTVTVTAEDGNSVTKPVTLGLNPGETVQSVTVSLPQVTATVEPAPGSAPAAAPTTEPAQPAAPTAAPAPAPAPQAAPSSGGDFLSNVIGWIILGVVLAGAYVYLKNKGVTVNSALKSLGIQPDTVAAGGGTLAGASVAPAPGAAPVPPPVVADPNQCPFCGQMKDAAGNCSCSVLPGAAGAAGMGGMGGMAAAPAGSGPRLVGMAGTYMGTVFPLSGLAVIGREPTNPIPLDRDTTASRRHAQISDEGGVFRVQDLGSSNGTFVNGARVTETVLQPGDEVSIGGTRFRFEV